MAGIINVPSTILDPQLRVLLGQLREATISTKVTQESVVARMSVIEQGSTVTESDPDFVRVPSAPSSLQANGLFQKIVLTWAGGTTVSPQASVSHAEIWRSATNNRGTAVLRATSVGDAWTDNVENGQAFYYWVRFVNTAGVPSLWSSGVYGGVFGQTVLNPADVIPVLSGKITTSELATALTSRINLIDAPSTGLVTQISQVSSSVSGHTSAIQTLQTVTGGLEAHWSVKTQVNNLVGGIGFYNNGVTTKFYVNAQQFAVFDGTNPTAIAPFIVDSGQVYIDAAMIKDATITSAKIQTLAVEQLIGDKAAFVTANIADASITTAKIGSLIESTNYVAGASGWRITKAGIAEFRNVIARGDIEAQSLKANTAMVDTLHVNGSAITTMFFASGGATTISANDTTTLITLPVTMPSGSSGVVVSCSGVYIGEAPSNAWRGLELRILKNGTTYLHNTYYTALGNIRTGFHIQGFDSDPTGSNTYTLVASVGPDGDVNVEWPSMTAVGGKR